VHTLPSRPLQLSALLFMAGCAVKPVAAPHRDTLRPCDDCLPGIVNFAPVSPTLWRGAQPSRSGFRSLAAAGVTMVINLRTGEDGRDDPLLEGTGLRAVQIPMKPWRPDRTQVRRFLETVDAERRRGGRVFVHCQQGRDRTGYAVAAYRMAVEGWTAEEAITEMFDFRFNAIWRNNPGFLRRLEAENKEASGGHYAQ
jgi:tyrosine-protein phosphatase SIW14